MLRSSLFLPLFTELPRRGILGSSPRGFSKVRPRGILGSSARMLVHPHCLALQDSVADTSPTIPPGGIEENGQQRSPQAPRDPAQRPQSGGNGSSPPTSGGGAHGGHDLRARGGHL